MNDTLTYHFWIGKFCSEAVLLDFVAEDEGHYQNLDDDTEDELPLSKFINSQGETWIDHDFMESGFEKPVGSIKKQFQHYSFADNWIDEFEQRCLNLTTQEFNVIIMVSKQEMNTPASVIEDSFELYYLGEIEFEVV